MPTMPSFTPGDPLSKQLTIIIGLTVVGFMAFGLALSFYRNLLFEETLKELGESNRQIAADIEQGYRDLEYFRSEQYKDKFAKENLNLLNRGEKLIIISRPAPDPFGTAEITQDEAQQKEAAYQEILLQMPVIEHWQLYLFHRERLKELKDAL